jgi:hypothetical protein
MRPGKKLTPRPLPDLEKIWRELDEEPPGPIIRMVSPVPLKPRKRRFWFW